MAAVTVFCPATSSRLVYVLDWLLADVLNLSYRLVHNEADTEGRDFFISYGRHFNNALNIPDRGLLWQDGIIPQEPGTGNWNGLPTLFPSEEQNSVPFDLFSAVFFLLSRYEEYYPFEADKHGRYPPELSILYRQGWLQRPVVDEWIAAFYNELSRHVSVPSPEFSWRLSYDIDIAWSNKYKGLLRSAGGLVKELTKANFSAAADRLFVLAGVRSDPFDCFEWLTTLHAQLPQRPLYFLLTALQVTAFDKNIHPQHPKMVELTRRLAEEGDMGMHPSYYSVSDKVFAAEKRCLEAIIRRPVDQSRQHYIRLYLPDTYRQLLGRGIREDYSMGYGSRLGFRAGTGRSFNWYDLAAGQVTALRLHPFCFMDSTARFEEGLTAEVAFQKLGEMKQILQNTGSRLITVFHNFSLGRDGNWKDWKAYYQAFIERLNRN